MDITAEEALREIQEIRGALLETVEYLERLPPVPVTREFCRKLRARLEAKPVKIAAGMRAMMQGQAFTAAGLPMLEASLGADHVLTIGMPRDVHGAMREQAFDKLASSLKDGHTFSMKLVERLVRDDLATPAAPVR